MIHDVRRNANVYFVKLGNGCVASAVAAMNMRTATVIHGSAGAVAKALDEYAGRAS
jgi:hypothetical protein